MFRSGFEDLCSISLNPRSDCLGLFRRHKRTVLQPQETRRLYPVKVALRTQLGKLQHRPRTCPSSKTSNVCESVDMRLATTTRDGHRRLCFSTFEDKLLQRLSHFSVLQPHGQHRTYAQRITEHTQLRQLQIRSSKSIVTQAPLVPYQRTVRQDVHNEDSHRRSSYSIRDRYDSLEPFVLNLVIKMFSVNDGLSLHGINGVPDPVGVTTSSYSLSYRRKAPDIVRICYHLCVASCIGLVATNKHTDNISSGMNLILHWSSLAPQRLKLSSSSVTPQCSTAPSRYRVIIWGRRRQSGKRENALIQLLGQRPTNLNSRKHLKLEFQARYGVYLHPNLNFGPCFGSRWGCLCF